MALRSSGLCFHRLSYLLQWHGIRHFVASRRGADDSVGSTHIKSLRWQIRRCACAWRCSPISLTLANMCILQETSQVLLLVTSYKLTLKSHIKQQSKNIQTTSPPPSLTPPCPHPAPQPVPRTRCGPAPSCHQHHNPKSATQSPRRTSRDHPPAIRTSPPTSHCAGVTSL